METPNDTVEISMDELQQLQKVLMALREQTDAARIARVAQGRSPGCRNLALDNQFTIEVLVNSLELTLDTINERFFSHQKAEEVDAAGFPKELFK